MKKSVKISLIIIIVFISLIALSVGAFFLIISPNINVIGSPELDTKKLTSYSSALTILDKDGVLIDNGLYGGNYSVKIDELNDYTKNAFIAVEDKRFYKHHGIDYKRMASAALSNIKSRSFREGASTITQQLIKNTHLSNEKTIKRKLSEMRLARKLEKQFEKDEILESYLNILYFGSGINGLGNASHVIFDKPATELTLAQSAALASIINNPTKYNPYTNSDNLNSRKNLVLQLMKEQGYIDDFEYNAAVNEELIYYKKRKSNRFIEAVINSACKKLNCSEKDLLYGSYIIYTDYDSSLCENVRDLIKEYDVFGGRIRVLILENSSGDVVCDESNSSEIEIRRSPASTIKPFVSYAPALESGLSPLSQILDEPTDFDGYAPNNYKDVYRGWQSIEQCLINSSNVAAVKLLSDIGIEKCASIATSFGLPVMDGDKNLALALGGMTQGLTLTEIANAYRTLANGGIYSATDYIDNIVDADGLSVYKNDAIKKRVTGDDTAYILTDMLVKCAREGTAKKLKNIENIAAKTGTNGDKNGNTDCYCIAYTPTFTIAVWFGAGDELIDNDITGATCCKLVRDLCASGLIKTDQPFIMPKSVGYYEIDDREFRSSREIYLADPLLPKRYRRRALLSKKNLPIRKNIDYIDFFDGYDWENMFKSDYYFFAR